MKAIIYQRYGSPDVLELKDVENPSIEGDGVLVNVLASSVNSWDWDLLRGTPFVNRMRGLLRPQYKILGADIAGRVQAVGRDVKKFQIGDEVYGDISACGWGGFAEYVSAPEDALSLKPANLTFEESAAVPQAALLALQGLRDKGRIQPGQTVLINGAGGGVGTFAVQIAKSFGVTVTGVDSTSKLDMVLSNGADQFIDYTHEDFIKSGKRYDLILDVVEYRSIFDYKRALSPEGIFVIIGGSTTRILQTALLGPFISVLGGKKMRLLLHKPNTNDLDFMKELLEAGKVVPVIGRRYPLSDVAEALRFFGQGEAQGKIVITV